MGKQLQIVALSLPEEILASQLLRKSVWMEEGIDLSATSERIIISHDEHALHWGSYDQAVLIGACRLCIHPDIADAPDGEMFEGLGLSSPVASMNRLVVRKDYRGYGLGSRFDLVRIDCARSMGAKSIIVAPIDLPHRIDVLRKEGFVVTDRTKASLWSSSVVVRPAFMRLEAESGR